jgi:hypothetical protein
VTYPSEDKHNLGFVKSLTKICSSVRVNLFQTRSKFVFRNVISCLHGSSRIHLLSYRTASPCIHSGAQRIRLILVGGLAHWHKSVSVQPKFGCLHSQGRAVALTVTQWLIITERRVQCPVKRKLNYHRNRPWRPIGL